MKYIVKICGNKLEKCDFRNMLLSNKDKSNRNFMKQNGKEFNISSFNETSFKKNITSQLEKKMNGKFKELELMMKKNKIEIENKVKKEFEARDKKKEDEIKKLQEELKSKISEIKSIQENTKQANNLRNNMVLSKLNKFKQKSLNFVERGQKGLPNRAQSESETQNLVLKADPTYEELEKEFDSLVGSQDLIKQNQNTGYVDMNSPVNKYVNDYYYNFRNI